MSPVLPREERDVIRARADRATEGPWGHHAHTHGLPSDEPTRVCVFDPEDVPVAELDYSSWGERDAEFIAHARTDVPALLDALDAAEAEVDALRARIEWLRAVCEDQRGARKVAADAADRFRDVLAECLGHDDNNPGDDVLVAEVRARFGKTGPEPTRWRDFLTGALALLDQINAMPDPSALLADPTTRTTPESTNWHATHWHLTDGRCVSPDDEVTDDRIEREGGRS